MTSDLTETAVPHPRERAPAGRDGLLRLAAGALAICIFLFDLLSPLGGAVAVLYVLVLGIVARTSERRDILMASAISLGATVIAYLLTHLGQPDSASALRGTVSLVAIGGATLLMLKIQTSTVALQAQAGLLDLSHDMIFMRDPTGHITFWNRAAREVYGWSEAEALGRVADELLRTGYEMDRDEVDRVLLQTGAWEGVLEHRTRTGARILVHSRWAVQRDAQGRIRGVLESNTDITEQRAQHQALIRSERRFRRMFEASRIGVVQENWTEIHRALRAFATETGLPDHVLAQRSDFVARARRLTRVTDVNPALLNMIGLGSRDEYVATVDDLLSAEDRTFGPALAAYAAGAAFFEGETSLVHADGRAVAILFTMTFPSPHDEDGSVMIFCMDVTEQRQAQDALASARAELAHAARVATLGELSASIAHEVNQPLMAIVTSGEAGLRWLRRGEPDLHEVGSALERVAAEGRRAGEIVQRIRSYLGHGGMNRDPVAVAPLIRDATALVAREMERADVAMALRIAPDLPLVLGDKVQLQQVLVNLLLNAAQAMAQQETPRRIQIAAMAAPPGIRIEVRDTGPGIGQDQLEQLFQPFFTTKADGMGMGLAICRRIIEAHGGAIGAEAAPGGGLKFVITLPIGGA
jgi:PAS domain S-box-containing protein